MRHQVRALRLQMWMMGCFLWLGLVTPFGIAQPYAVLEVDTAALTTSGFAFSPDGRSLFWTCWDQVRVWEVASGRQRCQYGPPLGREAYASPCFLCGGKKLLVRGVEKVVLGKGDQAFQRRVDIYNLPTLERIARLEGTQENIMKLAGSPDGSKVLTTYDERPEVVAWDALTGKRLFRIPVPFEAEKCWPSALAISPDRRSFAV